ncbi:MFS transporter [Aminipila butyrica]|uniref:MFS transporter n=1 Tax=Aminipila butyrica TaxID=433296 RepID=A0A858BTC6_9FIRM|nr:MFS transporter [Aminipila butyrica]QIB68190.1 MFS transporter [Aminipila butyrica]
MKEHNQKRILLFLVIITTAICLRAPITSVGSILYAITADLQLSNTVAGSITTIPLIVMALLSPWVSQISRRTGIIRALLIGLSLLLAGILLRSFGGIYGLLTGTALIGAGISFGNVLIPAVIKSFFSDKIGAMTGVFTTTMSICSGIGAGISVPLAVELGWGWRWTFCVWAVTVLVAMAVSAAQLKHMGQTDSGRQPEIWSQKEEHVQKQKPLYQVPLAWWMAVLFGGQSCVFYMLVSWLPTIAADRGVSVVAAGMLATVFQVAAIPANFGVPMLAGRWRNQSPLATAIAGLGVIGLIGFLLAGSVFQMAVSVAILALGLGGTFSLSLVFFAMRASDGNQAVRLSGFAQSVGYVLAAIGPALAGALYDWSHNWSIPLLLAVFIMVVAMVAGTVVGRDRQI